MEYMEVSPLERVQEEGHVTQQSPSPRLDDNSLSENVAYLQKTINDPTNAIVQHQIQGDTAKMLVILATGEQRLITFDIPKEDCTVHDLLNQLNITFFGKPQVSLVDDPYLGVNYIVDARGSGMCTTSLDGSDGDCNSSQKVVSTATTENLSQNTNTLDENSNTSSQTTEEPILIKGMLALCPHCGFNSLDFNRCERCNTKFKTEEVKSIPERKETGMSVDMFYKKNNKRNATKLEKIERDGPTCKRPRPKGKDATSKTKPNHKEPECFTISSDEEEEGRIKKIRSINSNTVTGNASNSFSEDMDTIIDKEPIIINDSVSCLYDDLMDNEENSKDAEVRWRYLSKQKTKNGQPVTKMAKWRYQDQMSFLRKFVNQDRPRITSIDEISVKKEEEDSCKEIKEEDSQEHAETTTVIQNNDDDLSRNNDEPQTNSKTLLIDKKKPKLHSVIQESDNQDRPRLTSIDEISIKEEEEDSCKEIKEEDFQEYAETTTVTQNNDEDLSQNNDKSQANSKTVLINEKKPKLHSAIQESASTTLMKYLTEKKQKKESKVSHPMDSFFSSMAATVKNFSSVDQHYVKTKVFSIVNDIENKYLMQPFANFTSSQESPIKSSPQQSSVNTTSLQQSPYI